MPVPPLLLVAVLAGAATSSTAPAEPGRIQFVPETIPWASGPATLPPGARMAVLEGNPRGPGLFTIRIRLPAGSRLPAHWHPADERVTVIAGSVHVGFGERLDVKAAGAKVFKVGAYYVNPANVRHFVWTDEDAVLQITGLGPWDLRYVNPADDPRLRGVSPSGTPLR